MSFEDEDTRGGSIEVPHVEGYDDAMVIVRNRLENVLGKADVEGDVVIRLFQSTGMGESAIEKFVHEQGGDVDETAKDIVDAAADDAMEHPGAVRYGIRIVGLDKVTKFELYRPRTRREDRFPHRSSRYLPTDAGDRASFLDLVSQLMDHNDSYARMIGSQGQGEREFLYKVIENLQAENMQLKKGWFEVMRQAEDLSQMSHVRRLEIAKFESEDKRKDVIVGALKELSPMLALGAASALGIPPQMLTMMNPEIRQSDGPQGIGQSAGPEDQRTSGQADPSAEWVQDFAAFQASLTQEQQEVLFKNLDQSQLMILMRMRERAEEWVKKQQARQSVGPEEDPQVRRSASPEDDPRVRKSGGQEKNGKNGRRYGYSPFVPKG